MEIGEKFGHLAHNKFIPNFILDLPVERLKKFINGYMDGDGHIRKGKASKVNIYKRNTTVSEKLALTLSLAIQKCYNGVSITHTNRKNKCLIENRIVNQKDTYEVSYTENKTFFSKYKNINNYTIYNLTKNKSFIENGIKKVYNIEVEEDNSYIVNNLIVHNCQGFSFAGKQLNFEDERSKLFFEFIRLKDELKPKYFLLENVVMKKEYENVITNYLGVEPILINSNLVSAQNRKRLYWTNIPNITIPEDKNIYIKDIIYDDEYKIFTDERITKTKRKTKNYIQWDLSGKGYNSQQDRAYYKDKKMCTLPKTRTSNKLNIIVDYDNDVYRRMHPIEAERCQNVPDNYTNVEGVRENKRFEMLGNGWTVDVIAHIFKNIKL